MMNALSGSNLRHDALFKIRTYFQQIFTGIYLYACATLLALVGQSIGKSVGIMQIEDSNNILFIAVIGGLIFIAINTPILFRFGSEKGRFVFIIAMAIIGASGPILQKIDSRIILDISGTSPILLFTTAIAINVISVIISINIKKSKS